MATRRKRGEWRTKDRKAEKDKKKAEEVERAAARRDDEEAGGDADQDSQPRLDVVSPDLEMKAWRRRFEEESIARGGAEPLEVLIPNEWKEARHGSRNKMVCEAFSRPRIVPHASVRKWDLSCAKQQTFGSPRLHTPYLRLNLGLREFLI